MQLHYNILGTIRYHIILNLVTNIFEQYHVDFKDMAISSLPWLFMFFLIPQLEQSQIKFGQSRFVARGDCYRWICSVLCINFLAVHTDALQYFVVQFVIALFLIWLPTYLAEQYHVDFKDMVS